MVTKVHILTIGILVTLVSMFTTVRFVTKVLVSLHGCPFEFDVYGSVHLGNIYVRFKVQLDVLFYVLFLLLYS
jgi:hypothetical protein